MGKGTDAQSTLVCTADLQERILKETSPKSRGSFPLCPSEQTTVFRAQADPFPNGLSQAAKLPRPSGKAEGRDCESSFTVGKQSRPFGPLSGREGWRRSHRPCPTLSQSRPQTELFAKGLYLDQLFTSL